MIGLVIVAHGGLGCEFLAAVEHVVGPQEKATVVSMNPEDDLAEKQAEIDAAVASVNDGAGVVVVTDMFGGTPCNLAIGAMSGDGVEVIYGANLPMLVKLAKSRTRPLEEAVDAAIDAGRKYIDAAGRMLQTKAV
ncbi:PTS fructose transporter subunit IIA [Pikeienuella sp. HZG-20]|uniref:PTS sugar transporter subunit IIA n=1 Tax=Paludibacillus litoralis TaxID=3133267 RepID=UPI0030EE7335